MRVPTLLALLFAFAAAAPGSAQSVRQTVIITASAPVFAAANDAQPPLRVAKEGSVLLLVDSESGWYHVEFEDPEFGRRLGYVRQRYARLDVAPAQVQTIDGGIRDAAARPIEPPQPSAFTPALTRPQVREGFWFNTGLGIGMAGCVGCAGRAAGASGGLSLGGTINPRLLLGVGTTGWYKSANGLAVNGGTFDVRMRLYPAATSGFFLTGGAGLGSISASDGRLTAAETGAGVLLGLGWDIRTGRNVSVTPFYNGFAIGVPSGTFYVDQFGVGVTIH